MSINSIGMQNASSLRLFIHKGKRVTVESYREAVEALPQHLRLAVMQRPSANYNAGDWASHSNQYADHLTFYLVRVCRLEGLNHFNYAVYAQADSDMDRLGRGELCAIAEEFLLQTSRVMASISAHVNAEQVEERRREERRQREEAERLKRIRDNAQKCRILLNELDHETEKETNRTADKETARESHAQS